MKVGCHGLNRYDGFHNIYFSAALNREPRHLRMLKALGFDLAYVHEATTHEVIYQVVMRTSLRRPDDKPRPLWGTERNQRSKVTKLTQSLFAAKSLRTPLIEEERHHIAAEIQIPRNSPTCFVTFYENRYATRQEDFFVHRFTCGTAIRDDNGHRIGSGW